MSGHSKWSTIKHKKAKVDSQRAVVFQKYSRELIVAARLGGPDPAVQSKKVPELQVQTIMKS